MFSQNWSQTLDDKNVKNGLKVSHIDLHNNPQMKNSKLKPQRFRPNVSYTNKFYRAGKYIYH